LKRKITTVVFDADLKTIVKKYPVSDSGDRINIKKGGEAHFMPQFDHSSYLDMPRPWYKGGGFERTYFVRKLATTCVNFETESLTGPDPEQLKQAVGSTMLNQLGHEKPPFPSWIIYLILLCVLGTTLKVFGVIA